MSAPPHPTEVKLHQGSRVLEIAFDDGLGATVEWYAANRAWWEPLKGRAPVRENAWS